MRLKSTCPPKSVELLTIQMDERNWGKPKVDNSVEKWCEKDDTNQPGKCHLFYVDNDEKNGKTV